MAVGVRIDPHGAPRRRQRGRVAADVELFVELLSRLASGDRRALRNELAHLVVDAEERPGGEGANGVTGEPVPSQAEQARLGFHSLLQFFETRRQLLEDAVTAPQAAELLGVSRQTPLNRVRDNSLLAILDRGAYRFPVWQFDPQGEDGVLPGLRTVLEALEPQQPFAKAVWLRRPSPELGGREPVELLRERTVEPVVDAARAAARLP